MRGRRVCVVGGHAWQEGVCMAGGGVHGRGACVVGVCMMGGMHARYYEIRSMSGRYASYWNAYLFQMGII